jgi:glycosyltransferase involved in cell wall biosynthesis
MLTVITHTRFDRPEMLERCKASVKAALPENAQHIIIECRDYKSWVIQRVLDAKEHDIIAFVDDDDYIHPDALNTCLTAIEKTGLGAACTDEVIVSKDEKIIRHVSGKKTYYDSTIHPRVIHHLCLMRGPLIDIKAIDLHNKYGVGIEWFIRESVVLQHGCVHVPIGGYYWTEHPDQHTMGTRNLYAKSLKDMQYSIRETWPEKFKGPLPVFDLTSF